MHGKRLTGDTKHRALVRRGCGNGCEGMFDRRVLGTDAACYAPAVLPADEGACMPHIALNSDEPGIRGLLRFRPHTGRPLTQPRDRTRPIAGPAPGLRPAPPLGLRR